MIEESPYLCYRKRSKNIRDHIRCGQSDPFTEPSSFTMSGVHYNHDDDDSCNFVAQDLDKHHSNLSSPIHAPEIKLPYNHLNDEQIMMALSTRLLPRINNKSSVETTIDLSWNNFGPQGVEAIFHQLQQRQQQIIIKRLDLKGNDIGRCIGSKSIASFFFNVGLEGESENQENNINQNNISASSSSPSRTKETKTVVKSLDLSNTNVNVALIATSIQHSTSLESLYLDENQLTIQDIHALGNMLMVNKHLKTLSLRNCQLISDNGDKDENGNRSSCMMDHDYVLAPSRMGSIFANALVQGLSYNTSLQELDISWNPVFGGTSGGIDLLTCIFRNNPSSDSNTQCQSLQKVHLQGTNMNDTDLIHLCHMLSKNSASSTLRSVNLSGNDGITDGSVDALIHMLKAKHCLVEELYLSSNSQISMQGHMKIVEGGLANNYTLQEYRIAGCCCLDDKEGKQQLLLQQSIDFYIKLNKQANRKRLLLENNSIPLPLWPQILERINDDPSCTYYVLREIPNLLSMAELATTATRTPSSR